MKIDPTGMFGDDPTQDPIFSGRNTYFQMVDGAVSDVPRRSSGLPLSVGGPALNSGTLSPAGRDWLLKEEGTSIKGGLHVLYNDDTDMSKANATIGYGHLVHYKPVDGSEPQQFKDGLTQPEANSLLSSDLPKFERNVGRTVGGDKSQDVFDAYILFAFNVGSLTKDVRKAYATGNPAKIEAAVKSHTNNGNTGLVGRRGREASVMTGKKSIAEATKGMKLPRKAEDKRPSN